MTAKDYDVPAHAWPENAIVRGIVINGVLREFPEPIKVFTGDVIRWRIESAPDEAQEQKP